MIVLAFIVGVVVGVATGSVVVFVLCVRHLVKRQVLLGPDGTRLAVIDVKFGTRKVRCVDAKEGNVVRVKGGTVIRPGREVQPKEQRMSRLNGLDPRAIDDALDELQAFAARSADVPTLGMLSSRTVRVVVEALCACRDDNVATETAKSPRTDWEQPMILTLANLKALCEATGVPFGDIAVDPPPRIVANWGDLNSKLMLELRTYKRDEHGNRFFDKAANRPATEVRLVTFEVVTVDGWPTIAGENGLPVAVPEAS